VPHALKAPTEEQLLRCIRCGLCLSVCPTYRSVPIETRSPRGRLALIKAVADGQLPVSRNFVEQMSLCLDCRACTTVCPTGVSPGEMVLAARAYLEAEGGKKRPDNSFGRRMGRRLLYRELWPHHRRLERLASLLRLYQRLRLPQLARRTGLLRLLPDRLARMEELLPILPERSLRREIPVVAPAKGETRYRVGFFLGCVMSLVYVEVSRATVRVLQEHGCEVVTPQGQKCCGAPHESDGERDLARQLARDNVGVFERLGRLDAIVTDCAACGAVLKGYGELLAGDRDYAERAGQFSARVADISEFLMRISRRPARRELAWRVTYHDPCHLVHAQGISREPRELLRSIPGIEFVELSEANWCCGSAGTYNLTHPEMSAQILAQKVNNIAATGAEVVVTANPGCMLQLQAGLRRAGLAVRVVHTTQVLDEATGGG